MKFCTAVQEGCGYKDTLCAHRYFAPLAKYFTVCITYQPALILFSVVQNLYNRALRLCGCSRHVKNGRTVGHRKEAQGDLAVQCLIDKKFPGRNFFPFKVLDFIIPCKYCVKHFKFLCKIFLPTLQVHFLLVYKHFHLISKVSNCAGVYRLEHNYIVRYIKISQLHVSALMAIFRLDTKLDEKTIYNMVHYIHKCGVRGEEISSPLYHTYVCNVPYYI